MAFNSAIHLRIAALAVQCLQISSISDTTDNNCTEKDIEHGDGKYTENIELPVMYLKIQESLDDKGFISLPHYKTSKPWYRQNEKRF